MHLLILLGLAAAPGVAIALYIYLKDKHEREPLTLLMLSFLYGAFSTMVTLAISWPVEALVILRKGDIVDEFLGAMFKVALIEEFSKFIFVRFLLYRNKNFNEPFDGIVYSVMVGMGFATLENILYVFNGGLTTAILRMFTAVPAHATFAVLMGYFLGRAKFSHRNGFLLAILALGSATLFHGLYDYFWFLADTHDEWTLIGVGSIIALVIGFILSRQAIRLHQQISPFINMHTSSEKHAAEIKRNQDDRVI
jgi:RsiW-degrading membrane proteinase PrsW (M82 family)